MASSYKICTFVLWVVGCQSFSILGDVTNLPSMFGSRIKHVVAIMFENRSFDHLLGHLVTQSSKYDGCSPAISTCTNPLDPTDTDSPQIPVGFDAVYVQPGDPGHSISSTSHQLYGPNASNNGEAYPALMNGFVADYSRVDQIKGDQGKFIMQCFNQSSLPILSTLATEFATFNSWYADVPGPTEPNRIYSWMTTSQGLGDDDAARLAEGFTGPSVFKMFDDYWNYTNIPSTDKWRTYWQTFPTSAFVEWVRLHPENGHFMDDFFSDVEKGDLPLFSWLDPNYSQMPGFPAADQHPDHDVTEGEKLLKRIYQALRNSTLWNDTLLLVFYDEHGGFYDHVSPSYAPNPDGINATKYGGPFDFSRLGLRVPAVLISPWIPKGYVVEHPAQNDYHNASQYSHSSLVHTLREQYTPDCPAFSKRDSWSLTFEHVVMQLDEPRTDCPMTLPNVPKSNVFVANDDSPNADSFQNGLFHSVATLCGMTQDRLQEILSAGSEVYGPALMQCVQQWQSGDALYHKK